MIAQTLTKVFANSSHIIGTCFVLLLFFSVFVGVIFWIYRKGSGDIYQLLRKIPLESEKDI